MRDGEGISNKEGDAEKQQLQQHARRRRRGTGGNSRGNGGGVNWRQGLRGGSVLDGGGSGGVGAWPLQNMIFCRTCIELQKMLNRYFAVILHVN